MPMSRKAEAEKLTKQAKELNQVIGRSWLARGKIYRRMIEAKLWPEAGYESLDEWLEAVGDVKKSQAYDLSNLYSELEATAPPESVAKMTANNARIYTKLPQSQRRDAANLAAAEEMTEPKFRQFVQTRYPDLKIEASDYKGFKLQESALPVVMQTITEAMERFGFKAEGEALEYVCQEWRAGQGGVTAEQRAAARETIRVVEDIVVQNSAALPTILAPSPQQWAQVLVAITKLQDAFNLPARVVKAGKSTRRGLGSAAVPATVQ